VTSVAGEHHLPAEIKLKAALAWIVPHLGRAATSASLPVQVPFIPTKRPAFRHPAGWTMRPNHGAACSDSVADSGSACPDVPMVYFVD
jgi:hypothetical protein